MKDIEPEVKDPVPNGLVRVILLLEIAQPAEVLRAPVTDDIVQDEVVGKVMVVGNVISITESLGIACWGVSVI